MWRHLWRYLFILFLFTGTIFAQRGNMPSRVPEDNRTHQGFPDLIQKLLNSGQNFPTYLLFDQSIPEKVMKAKEDSIVPIDISFLHNDQAGLHRDVSGMVGFVVWENYVLTALHFNEYPSIWKDKDTIITVFDGRNYFYTELVFHESYPSNPHPSGYLMTDLVLLKVLPSNNPSVKFSKKPVILAESTYVIDKVTEKYKIINDYRKFYLFYFNPNSPLAFLPLEIGPYYAVDNLGDLNVFIGTLQGSGKPGFSGSPLVTPDGEVLGMAIQTDYVYTYVITIETVKNFLKEARQALSLN